MGADAPDSRESRMIDPFSVNCAALGCPCCITNGTPGTIVNNPQTKSDIVSSESEALILVDANDQVVGHLDKSACHDGDGVLHRAFSLFIFNSQGQLLLQQRAAGKRLWGGYWSNSCCSHPRQGESMELAIHRRLEQELGMSAELTFAYKFEYAARFKDLGTEHELCWVYIGVCAEQPVINTTEIDDWRWIDRDELTRELAEHPDRFTPWLQMEWARLTSDFPERLP